MFTKSTSNEIIDNVLIELESYFHKFKFSYWFQSFHVKCRPIVTLQNIGGFGLNFLYLTPLIQNPGSATAAYYSLPLNLATNYLHFCDTLLAFWQEKEVFKGIIISADK